MCHFLMCQPMSFERKVRFGDRFHMNTCEGRSCLTMNIHIIDEGRGIQCIQ